MSFGPDRTPNVWSLLGFAWELGYTIAVPIVALALLGRLLDRVWGTTPWMLLTGILIAIVVSGVGVVRKLRNILARDASKEDRPSVPPSSKSA
ncbi:AtpZ/AtpI family protein [Candidatus Uhrbacteria bacterium]|nr:AtpZ/AtpI family protein [Candidatus Uhrbacteria bacterium]